MIDQETTHRATVSGPYGDQGEFQAECPCGFKGVFTLSEETAKGHARFHYNWNLKVRAMRRAEERVRQDPSLDPAKAYFNAKNEIREEDS